MAETTTNRPKWIGQSMKRVEDPRFLRGKGRYIDDIQLPNMAVAAVLRSPHAHARIVRIDTSAAERLPGVHVVVTGKDVAERMAPLPTFAVGPIYQHLLAVDKVRHVGEGVAAVVAENRYIAEDACDLIEVEYEPLPPVVDPFEAMKPDAPLVHEALGSNIAYARTFTFGEFERDFADADHIVRAKLYWPRSSGMPMETNGAIGDYDEGTGLLTVYANSMSFTYFQWLIATSLKIPASKLRVVPINAGGSFGSKFFMHKVPTMAGFLSMVAGRPVKYIEDRIEHILANDHCGSDRHYDVALAVDRDGTMRALKISCVDDYGAYLQFGTGTHGNALAQVTGPYRIPSVQYELTAVLTNKNQQGAYRGFGSEVNNWVLERMVDFASQELGIDPVEIRRKNFIRPDEFPYRSPTGNIYDSGNYEGVLEKALALADYDHWVAERERARKEGRYLGIGIVTAQERSVFSSTEFWFWFDKPAFPVTSSPESATVTIDPTGKFVVTLHSLAFWGNSPETVAAQVVAEQFDIDPRDVVITYADSQRALPGTGPGGSRYTVMVTGALVGASERLKDKIKKIAAHRLDVSPEDLEFREGKVQVKGAPDRSLTLSEIALSAYMFKLDLPEDVESGLEASFTYDHPYTTLPSPDRKDLGVFYPFMGHACHIAVVEVDPETGQFIYHKYAAVADAGTVVNPMTLDGHLTGGTAQGLGTALYEEYVYDENGQMLTANFMDYLVPTAMEVPPIAIDHQETPSPYTPYGIKGAGEGGRMMAPGVITSAIENALAPFGIRITELPITPSKLVQWIEESKARGQSTAS